MQHSQIGTFTPVVMLNDSAIGAMHSQDTDNHTASCSRNPLHKAYRLVGLVVKASTSRAEDPGSKSRLRRDFFSGSSHTSDFKIGTPVATLPGAWRYRGQHWDWSARCQYTCDWMR